MASPYAPLYPTFTPHTITVPPPSPSPSTLSPQITIHALLSPPTGPPLLLLHGAPQNLSIWHRLAPLLALHYTLILLDLRGYGASSKPAGSPADPKHAAYSKSAMAADCIAVMAALGYDKGEGGFYVCGHDRGGRVAHRLCVLYPEKVKKVILLDICPTLAMYSATSFSFARAYFHWFFLIQPAPLPEDLIVGNPQRWIESTMGAKGGKAGVDGIFDERALESYVKGVAEWEGVHGMCEDYRAAAGVDLEEQREEVLEGRQIRCPVRVLWGKKGVIEMLFDALGEWRKVADGEVGGEALDCGHYIPEEAPEAVVRHVKEFFVN